MGLHVATYIERMPDANLCGIDVNRETYNRMDNLWVAVVGRPYTVGKREIEWRLNDVVVDRVPADSTYPILYNHPLDYRHTGLFRVTYIENDIEYWAHEFRLGTCPVPMATDFSIATLVELLRKFRS